MTLNRARVSPSPRDNGGPGTSKGTSPAGAVNPIMMTVPRNERRRMLSAERQRRLTGDWGVWERIEYPSGPNLGTGFLRDVRAVMKNKVFSVLLRPVGDGEIHMAISSLTTERPSWWEAQRIKNEIVGEGATAVEVYPPQDEVVDGANMYHLWTVRKLPFTLTFPLSS